MTSPTQSPPPRLPIPRGAQLTLQLSIAGQVGAIVLGGRLADNWASVTGPETWRDQAWANMRGGISSGVQCTGAIFRTVSEGDPTVVEMGAPPSPAGFLSGATPLLAACTLVKWNTATGGRTGKGRTFLPGVPAGAIASDGRTLTSAHAAGVKTYLDSYLASSVLQSAGLDPAVLSFRRGDARVITSASVASIVGIQRRRMR